MALLEVEGLEVAIAGRRLVRGVSLTLEAGRVMGVVGESGSGKSLTALAIMGLLPTGASVSGVVRLEGRELTRLPPRELDGLRGQALGMVFQEPMSALNPVMRIGDQVAETVRLHRRAPRAVAARIARETLARVGLDPEAVSPARYPHQLSGGQRQRVAIAAAIALAPQLLIADEPTSALDVTTQAQIVALLRRLVAEDGMGLLLVSHDLALVAEAADEVVVMQAGEVVERGETDALFSALRHPYTRRLAAASTVVRQPRPVGVEGTPVLEARGIVRTYRGERRSLMGPRQDLRAVDGVDLTLRRGETVGIVGESGSGKSTLLRALLGLDAPQAGEVRLDGERFSDVGARVQRPLRRRIQAVFQDPSGSFDPRWTVERLVAEPLALLDAPPPAAERRARVERLLEQVGLKAADADRLPHAFSGGQRQRIALARALILRPEVLALDEATSALDVSTRAEILALLGELRASMNLACLIVTHDLAVVRAVADRVMVMQSGRIVEEGETEAVFAAPRHPYTAALLAATPDLQRALADRRAQARAAS